MPHHIKKKQTHNGEDHPILSKKMPLTFGQHTADRMTSFLGSWTFIISFGTILFVWIFINVYAWWLRWDPYPFILLNLGLSCLAALQVPLIMMSQNRQEQRDRLAAKYDYAVNRKAEREIQEIKKVLKYIEQILNKY